MSRVRVLRVIARMNVGGPALQVAGLTANLDPDRFDHRVLAGHVEEGETDYIELRAPDMPVTRVDGLGRSVRPADDLRALRRIVSEVREFRPHIVHTHTAKAGVLGRVVARWCDVPYTVHTFHGHLLHGYFSAPVTAAVRQVERVLAKRTTRLAAVGSQVRDDLLEAGIGTPEQYLVVPPGVDLPEAPDRSEARSQLDLPPDVPVVAFVARLTAVKRPDRFLEVARRLVAELADVVFLVAGEGEQFDQLRTGAADLGKRVRFLGWRGDVETIYAACNLVVLTSDNEGMPVSLIEAAMAGRAAVTTNVGSAAEVVIDGETGFVTTNYPRDLAERAQLLLTDHDLRHRFEQAASLHAQESFSVHRLVRDTENLYNQLVAGPSCQ